MMRRQAAAFAAALVALTLVGAPLTMADWGEQASLSVERVDAGELHEETPVLRYGDLSADARSAVRRAIESPDGHYTIYGTEDWPEEFLYSDHNAPGRGTYGVTYQGQLYRLDTYASGGFVIVSLSPFVVYGFFLGWLALRASRGDVSAIGTTLATASGVAFHLLGPEFDFPLLAPGQLIRLAAVVIAALVALTLWRRISPRASRSRRRE
ncbi:hypothetical protein [Halomicrobium salinisoli]|uniref:hypothetical protein n=1 Tax=Halomicrobium salinisoli TaxID=2878391 RepID=UPI001CF021FE|nr:hypothetical protein [Halomicrobium salinisoli]